MDSEDRGYSYNFWRHPIGLNYQGDLYMGQGGERYMVTSDWENVDKWGKMVKVAKKEGPPYENLEELKLLNAMKVCHI